MHTYSIVQCYTRSTMSAYKFIPPPPNAASLSPAKARAIFRQNGYYGSTSGFCVGHAQANVTMLPSSLADEFEEFCRKNYGPLPLIYRSKPGETTAPPLAKDSDIKWDLPRYVIYSKGQVVDDKFDLDGFSSMWGDFVAFYIGCSYSFEHKLVEHGIELLNHKERKNCSMFYTNIKLQDVGHFSGVNMVVTMRSVPKALVQTAVTITAQYPSHHGAPIHIGDPLRIGISDITKPDQGEPLSKLDDDCVLLFWACGVTNRHAISSAKPKLAFSHYPGSMFIADVQPEKRLSTETIEIVQLSRPGSPYFASLLGSNTAAIFSQLEQSLLEDPGNRGVAHLFVESDLLKAVLSLSHSKKIAVTTGFPANTDLPVKQETDGVSGALSICQALLTLGKEVTLISDHSNQSMFEKCVEKMVSLGAFKSSIAVLPFEKVKELMLAAPKDTPRFDCFVAIERAGKSADGKYRTMSNRNISAFVDPIDELFLHASTNQLVSTIGIGDGGNELGMGKVCEKVSEYIPHGESIACQTPADFLIAAGISDWAGYALSLGLYAVSQCSTHWRYSHHAINSETPPQLKPFNFLPSNEQVASLLEYMNNTLGIMDGVTKGRGSVDSVPIDVVLKKIEEMKKFLPV